MNTEQQIQSLQTHVEQLRAHTEQLRMKVEELDKKVTGEETPGGPPRIVNELLEKLDKTKEVDAGIIIGSVWRTKHGTASSMNTATGGFESWLKTPDSYVAKVVQPFCDPKSLAILKAFFDGTEKSKEDLQEISGIGGEELDKLLMTLMELRYIKCETKQSVKRGSVIKKDAFSLEQQHGGDLLLILLWRADEQRKYEEEGED